MEPENVWTLRTGGEKRCQEVTERDPKDKVRALVEVWAGVEDREADKVEAKVEAKGEAGAARADPVQASEATVFALNAGKLCPIAKECLVTK